MIAAGLVLVFENSLLRWNVSVLAVGSTCSVCVRADRAALLIDAKAYFAALRAAILAAEHTVYIVGWDVDTRTVLAPEEPSELPNTLLDFLNRVLEQRPHLRVYVLSWDFSVIYALERELMPSYKFGSMAHPRLVLCARWTPSSRRRASPEAGRGGRRAWPSVAGIDLTIRRWDTPRHAREDNGRRDPAESPTPPCTMCSSQ